MCKVFFPHKISGWGGIAVSEWRGTRKTRCMKFFILIVSEKEDLQEVLPLEETNTEEICIWMYLGYPNLTFDFY